MDENGLDIPGLMAHRRREGTLKGFGGDFLDPEQVLFVDTAVLIPAAIGDVITCDNVDQVRSRLIIEGANHPITPWADDALGKRGVVVVPDVVGNAGGVIVSYFEWVQNLQQFAWSEDRVNDELARRMTAAYHSVHRLAQDEATDLRKAAYVIAVAKVAEAAAMRGAV